MKGETEDGRIQSRSISGVKLGRVRVDCCARRHRYNCGVDDRGRDGGRGEIPGFPWPDCRAIALERGMGGMMKKMLRAWLLLFLLLGLLLALEYFGLRQHLVEYLGL